MTKTDPDEPDVPIATAQVYGGEAIAATPAAGENPGVLAQAPPRNQETVNVVAPSTMVAGYQFYVDAGGNKAYKVEVPPGGAVQGQQFAAIIVEHVDRGSHNIPMGKWRDGLCDCCTFGCCHPSCCCGFWCTMCALGQALTRLKMNFVGSPLNGTTPRMSAFIVMVSIWLVVAIIQSVFNIVIDVFDADDSTEDDPTWLLAPDIISRVVATAMAVFVLIVVFRTRLYVRHRYGIPEASCNGCEDCCCAFWCTPCTVCQMLRHTADYNTYPGGCCTEDGLAAGAPEVV